MDKVSCTDLLYLLLIIFIYFLNDIAKLRKMFSIKYKKKIQRFTEWKRIQFARELLIREFYLLGFEENTYLSIPVMNEK